MTPYLCDTSVWIAMSVEHHVHHQAVVDWFDAIDDPGVVLFCRSTQQSFLRLLTTQSVFTPYGGSPLTGEQAWEAYGQLAEDGRIGFYDHEPPGVDALWQGFTSRPLASPKLWMDAYLAAFALAGGLCLVTTDSAFRQFAALNLLVLNAPAAA